MTTLREAAQQALEVLEAGPDVDPIFAGETEDALRAALAEPVQEPGDFDHHTVRDQRFAELVAAAERGRICKQIAQLHDALSMASSSNQTKPQRTTIAEWWADRKRKPLTKEKIKELLDIETEALPSYRSAVEELPERFARAVERAHEIGVNK